MSCSISSEMWEYQGQGCTFYKIYLGIILFLSVITMSMIGWWTIKFIRIFGCKKKLQFLFLVTVFGSTIARNVSFSLEFYWRVGQCSIPISLCNEAAVYWLSSTLFSAAVIIHIFSFLYQLLRLKKFREGERQNQKLHHATFAGFIMLILFTYLGFVITACVASREERWIFRIFKILYSSTFLLIAVTYILVAVYFYKKVKGMFLEKAKDLKKRIMFSSVVISFSFFLRACLNIGMYLLEFNSRFNRHWLTNNKFWFPLVLTFYFILSEILPTLYICMSIKNIEKKINEQGHESECSNNNLGFTGISSLRESLDESRAPRSTLMSTEQVINN
ncbi:unnamed protein product [Moneuplotes crassus]|uniref:THH1/TOM1/TOM3 domain-containing protein n=1 Tax=Euplotes crassus TaxID=5936 RepID=A0AAD1XMM2_EUPCR|nr:unnamed protein product [Moneuplotes crassus]